MSQEIMSQEVIGWLLAIYAGAVVGWVTEQLTISRHGTLVNSLMGVLGAALANLGYTLLGPISTTTDCLIVGVIGALLVIAIIPKRKRSRKSPPANRSADAWKIYAAKK